MTTWPALLHQVPPWWWPLAVLAIVCLLVVMVVAALAVRGLALGNEIMRILAGAERD